MKAFAPTFVITLSGLCLSASEAKLGVSASSIQRQQLEEGIISSEWAQIGGKVQAGTHNWKESDFHVDISGDGFTLAVGSPLANANQGQVSVSRLNPASNEWEPMGSDIAGDEEYSSAGLSVSLSQDGTILAVGFPAFNELVHSGRCCGNSSVRVYKWNPDIGDWEQLGSNLFDVRIILEVDNPEYFLSNQAGWAVSLSDDGMSVAVGAPNYFLNGTGYVGQVRVYRFVGNDWEQLGQSITGNHSRERVGFSISLSGDATTLALGDPFATVGTNATVNGQVQVFRIGETEGWEPLGNIIAGDEEWGQTGYSVSISKNGTSLAVGHPNHGRTVGYGSGLVRVYQMNQSISNWDQAGQDLVPDLDLEWEDGKGYGDGRSVSLSGDGQTVAIAAPSLIINDAILGLVRLFRFNATKTEWDKIGRTIPGEAAYGSFDSRSDLVSLSSDGIRLVVGAPIHKICSEILDFSCEYSPQDFANWTGHVRVFDLTEGSMTPSPTSRAPTGASSTAPIAVPPATSMPSAPPTASTTSPTGNPTILVQEPAPDPTSTDSPTPGITPESSTMVPTVPPTNLDSAGASKVSTRRMLPLLLLSASLVFVL